jgi:endonuclease/exonuclease/phosphatase family metal-dependent hydrolase
MRLSKPLKIASLVSLLAISLLLAILFIPKKPTIEITVMTFNIENGGTQVSFNKVVEAIQKTKADVVGIQEAWGNTAKLAHALGWRYYDQQLQIISHLPLLKPASVRSLYTFVEVTPGKVIAIANIHLPDEPYGPELVRHGAPKTEVIANENKTRLPVVLPFINKLATLAKRGIPVFLTGDFNSPSHLDWTEASINKLPNHPYAIEWPITAMLAKRGFTDAYRQFWPDPLKPIVATWPASRPEVLQSPDHFNPTPDDLPDRIDFIFTAGPANVISSQLIGEANYQASNINITPWPSDHRAIAARFAVQPAAIPQKGLILTPSLIPIAAVATLSITPTNLHRGKAFTIKWKNAPGNRYDYILITPTNNQQLDQYAAVRLYTFGETDGSVEYNEENAKGNWLAWHTSPEGHWPLAPNTYDIKLMLDDSNTALAATQITVK